MKKFIYTISFAIICYSSIGQTQRTVTFKPGATVGQDAVICTSVFYDLEDINRGDDLGLGASAWTNQGYAAINRSLLKFDELSTIPSCATILSAELKLYGAPYYLSMISVGNSCYPGSSYSSYCPNRGLIQKITGSWDEQTVTWNNQPTTTTQGQIILPATTTQWNNNFTDNSANLVAMVQDWVSNSGANYGFMLKMETEVRYRSLMLTSSDHSDSDLWPELTVTYLLNDSCMDCEMSTNFSYTVNTDNLNSYTFTATYPDFSQFWTINGTRKSIEDSFNYTFSAGSYEVCYHRRHPMYSNWSKIELPCEKCITICVAEQNLTESANPSKEQKTGIETTNIIQGDIPLGDIIPIDDKDIKNVIIYPNPTNNEWNVKVFGNAPEKITLSVFDMNGKLHHSETNAIIAGENSFKIDSKNLTAGSYIMEIKGNNINFKEVVIKQ